MLSRLLWLGVILCPGLGVAVRDTPQSAGFLLSSAPRLHQHPLVLSFTCVTHGRSPPRFALDPLATSKPSPACIGRAEPLPFLQGDLPGAAPAAPESSTAESILNTHRLGHSYSQMGPDGTPKTSPAAKRHHFCPKV